MWIWALWFISRLLRHPAMKRSERILMTQEHGTGLLLERVIYGHLHYIKIHYATTSASVLDVCQSAVLQWRLRPLNLVWLYAWDGSRPYCLSRGTTTAEKLRGTKVWVPTPGRLRPAPAIGRAGCWVREGVAPPVVRVWVTPGFFFWKLRCWSGSLVTTCCEISCFLKTTANKLGDQYIVGPNHLFIMPQTSTGQRSFAYSAPAAWNSLPPALRENMSLATFKTKLKTYLFRRIHNDSLRPPGAVAAFLRFRRRDISDFTYLLTCLLSAQFNMVRV